MKALFLAGLLVAAPAFSARPSRAGSDPLLARAKAAVADQLKDPRSAQFRGVVSKIDSYTHLRVVCGEINGKNAYGGYVGFQKFAFVPSSGIAVIAPDDDDYQSMTEDERSTVAHLFTMCL
jgi:hypothetical protein